MRGRVSIAVVAVAVAAAAGLFWRCTERAAPRFVTAPVTKGDVARAIVTTGSVNPVVTVQVGTYVSGPIQSIYCDFNSEVEAGQLCAKIDPRSYQQAVDQARANLAIAEAQLRKDEAGLAYAQSNYERNRPLGATGVISHDALDVNESARDQAAAQVLVDRATIDSRRAALAAAQLNLDYTDIVSPVTGTVVLRNVDVGQTVAASFQTPTLFVIAQDLTKVQVDTNVSESDVGAARVGQRATFTVEAHPGRTFEGEVSQVRRAPITVQNVVTYDVVIACDNPDLLLFPGMTTDVRILVEERSDVLTIPEAALRFEPGGIAGLRVAQGGLGDGGQHVWVLRNGEPVAVPIAVGVDDGARVEIAPGALAVGDEVIVDMTGGTAAGDASPSRSPFRF